MTELSILPVIIWIKIVSKKNNDKIIQEKIKMLKKELKTLNIKHKENFKFLGYNPPYQLIDRKNEIIVEIYFYGL